MEEETVYIENSKKPKKITEITGSLSGTHPDGFKNRLEQLEAEQKKAIEESKGINKTLHQVDALNTKIAKNATKFTPTAKGMFITTLATATLGPVGGIVAAAAASRS